MATIACWTMTTVDLDQACARSDVALVRQLLEDGAACTTDALDQAASNGNEAIVELLLDHGKRSTEEALDWAATLGHLKVVQMLLRAKHRCSYYALTGAARNGHRTIVAQLLNARDPRVPVCPSAIDAAAENNHASIVRLLLDHGLPCSNDALDRAARHPQGYAVVKMLLEARRPCSVNVLDGAASGGNTATVAHLIRYGKLASNRASNRAIESAAMDGHLEIVKLLLDGGAPCDRVEATLKANIGKQNMEYRVQNGLYKSRTEKNELKTQINNYETIISLLKTQ